MNSKNSNGNRRSNSNSNKNNKSLSISFNIETLDMLLIYVYKPNKKIRRENLKIVHKLFCNINKNLFENNDQLYLRYICIRRILRARLKEKLAIPSMINDYIIQSSDSDEFKDDIRTFIFPILEDSNELNDDEIRYIETIINEKINFYFMYESAEAIAQNMERVIYNRFDSLSDLTNEVYDQLNDLMSKIRKARFEEKESENNVTFDSGFLTKLDDTLNDIKRPGNKLKSGLKYLNKMLKGGFESERFYLFLGQTGGFKSGILLNIVLWICEYNKIKTKSGKKPIVLYVTQENTIKETIVRMVSLAGLNEEINNYSNKEIIEAIKEKFSYFNSDIEIPTFKLIYKPNKSISTDDLYDLIDKTEDEGYEVIALVHDYIKRIKSAEYNKEYRLELGNIVDEMKVLAKEKGIPVISASQLNRDAIKIIENAIQSGVTDIGKKLGSSNVGESWAVNENSDYIFIIQKEKKELSNKEYLTFNLGKCRDKSPEFTYFAQPFVEGNGLLLQEDENTDKVYALETLSNGINNLSRSSVVSNDKKSVVDRKRKSQSEVEDYNDLPDLDV